MYLKGTEINLEVTKDWTILDVLTFVVA